MISKIFLFNNEVVEQVEVFKFLGCFIYYYLDWTAHTDEILTKAQQRMYFLARLKPFALQNDFSRRKSQKILVNFYQSLIQSILTM